MKAFASFLLCSSVPFSLAQTITTSSAMPVGRLLEDLSKQSGRHLQCAPKVKDDVVVLSCKDAQADDVLARIATVLHAQWTRSGENLVLSRDSNLVNADLKAETAAAAARVRAEVTSLITKMEAEGAFTPEKAKKIVQGNEKAMEAIMSGTGRAPAQQFQTNMLNSAGSRAIVRMLASMSDRDLAQLAAGRRTVYSNRPSRMQMPLPGNAFEAAKTFVREQQMIAAATPPPPSTGEQRIVIGGFADSHLGEGDPKDISTVMLVMNDNGGFMRSNGSVRLVIADSKGRTVCSGGFALPSQNAMTQTIGSKAPADEQAISLSPLTKEFDHAMALASGGGAGGQRRVMALAVSGSSTSAAPPASPSFVVRLDGEKSVPIPLSEDLRKALLSPQTVDPTSFSVKEGLAALAGATNLCAHVPDGAVVPVARFLDGESKKPSALRQFLEKAQGWSFSQDGGWTLSQPTSAWSARNQHVARVALANLLQTESRKKALSLSDLAAFAAAQPKAPASSDFDYAYAKAIDSAVADEALSPVSGEGEWLFVRFYGLLSPAQRQVLASNARLELRNLTPDQAAVLSEEVFQSPDGPSTMGPQSGPGGGMRFTFAGQSVTEERTFQLPNGLPSNGYVTMRGGSQNLIQGKDADGGMKSLSPEAIAFQKYQQENPSAPSFGPDGPTLPNFFRPASQNTYTMDLLVGENYGIRRQLQDTSIANGEFVTYDRLPKDVKDNIEQKLQMLREGMRNGGGRGRTVPPQN